jgi:hypothetical protein
MNSRRLFKIAAIKQRIEVCEAERRRLLKMLSSAQVNLAWIFEQMDRIRSDLRFLHHDLERLKSEDEQE